MRRCGAGPRPAGLTQTYRDTRDAELLTSFFALLDDATEQGSHASLIWAILQLMGLISNEMYARSSSSSAKRLRRGFAPELAAARQLLRLAP